MSLKPVEDKRKAVKVIQKGTQLSERRACLLVGIQRASMRYLKADFVLNNLRYSSISLSLRHL